MAKQTKPDTKPDPEQREYPAYWQGALEVSGPEHAAVVATGGWELYQVVTKAEYESARKQWREGVA